jgi:hypothetical protein
MRIGLLTAGALVAAIATLGVASPASAEGRSSRASMDWSVVEHDEGASASAADVAPTAACSMNVATDTTLVADVNDCTVDITAAGVTLDLAGHTIANSVILVSADDVHITRGRLEATNIPNTGDGSDALLDRLIVRHGTGFVVQPDDGWTIRDSKFLDNEVAIDVFFSTPGVTVANSRFAGNNVGVNVGKGEATTISNNKFLSNDIGVNLWDEEGGSSNDTIVERNRFDGNGIGMTIRFRCSPDFVSFGCTDAVRGTRVTRNLFLTSDSSGLVLLANCTQDFVPDPVPDPECAGDDTLLSTNLFVANGAIGTPPPWLSIPADDGLTAAGTPEGLDGVTLTGNVAIANADGGIEADGVVDGGGNKAAANGGVPCVGVLCLTKSV